jgi:signal peptidase I
MAPTLDAGQRVLVTAYPLTGGVGHGDVVIFEDTGNWYEGPAAEPSPGMQILSVLGFTSPAAGTQGVGRVVGMSGDRVECCDDAGRIKVNGQPLDERFLAGPTDQVPFDIRVPQGRIFVLGDARATALDSRSFLDAEAGTISLDDVTGRVLISVWPPTFVDGL